MHGVHFEIYVCTEHSGCVHFVRVLEKDSSSCNSECLVVRWAGLVSESGLCLLNRSVGGLCLVEKERKGFLCLWTVAGLCISFCFPCLRIVLYTISVLIIYLFRNSN